MSRQSKNNGWRAFCWVLFFAYIGILVYFLFFAEKYGRTDTGRFRYNLVLFQEIIRFMRHHSVLGLETVLLNLVGNIVGFMPFGFFLPLLSQKDRRLVMVLLLTFELSLVVEVVQLFTGVGSFDVDDLLLNTLGGVLGYGMFCMFVRLSKNGRS